MELKEIVERLNCLQQKAFITGITDEIRSEWKGLCEQLRGLGYRARRRHRNGTTQWYASSLERANTRNRECEYIHTDIRPNDGMRVLKGDCTTRAMAFCLDGVMSYREVEAEQYALAAQTNMNTRFHVRRNTNGTWEKVILDLGYVKVQLMTGVKRSVLGGLLANRITSPVCSHSRGHVAAIDQKGAVRDTWDSRGGRCDYLLVNGCDCSTVVSILEGFGVRTQVFLNLKKENWL